MQTVGDAEAKLQQVANADEKLRKQLAAIGRLLEGAIANESWSSVTAALGTLEAIVAGLSVVKAYGTGEAGRAFSSRARQRAGTAAGSLRLLSTSFDDFGPKAAPTYQ